MFNVAGDAFVNADVADLGLPILATDITFATLPEEAGCDRHMTAEEVYQRLLDHVPPSAQDCGSGSGGGRREWEQPLTDDHDDGSVSAADAEVIREESARKIHSAGSDVPSGLRDWAGDFLDP